MHTNLLNVEPIFQHEPVRKKLIEAGDALIFGFGKSLSVQFVLQQANIRFDPSSENLKQQGLYLLHHTGGSWL